VNKYTATIKVKGQSIKTVVFADSSIHARLILQYQFGMDCILSSPTLSTKEDSDGEPLGEIIRKIKPVKPLTPQQARIDTLKRQKEKAGRALDAERSRQKLFKDQQRIFNLSR
jgi:hypothetical protein